MSTYREVELRCDGVVGDPYGCVVALYAHTADLARIEARERGWRTNLPGGKDLCPDHRHAAPEGADERSGHG